MGLFLKVNELCWRKGITGGGLEVLEPAPPPSFLFSQFPCGCSVVRAHLTLASPSPLSVVMPTQPHGPDPYWNCESEQALSPLSCVC